MTERPELDAWLADTEWVNEPEPDWTDGWELNAMHVRDGRAGWEWETDPAVGAAGAGVVTAGPDWLVGATVAAWSPVVDTDRTPTQADAEATLAAARQVLIEAGIAGHEVAARLEERHSRQRRHG